MHPQSGLPITDRAQKLLSTSPGLLAVFHGLNYSSWLLAWIAETTIPIQLSISRALGLSLTEAQLIATPLRIARFASLVWDARSVLRLVGTLPLWIKFRNLITTRKPGADQVLRYAAFGHCIAYTVFHVLEHVALFTKYDILPATLNDPGNLDKLYHSAYWWRSVALFCSLASLIRERFVRNQQRAKMAKEEATGPAVQKQRAIEDSKWWRAFVSFAAFLPVAVPYLIEPFLPQFNNGVLGACGLLAGLGNLSDLWAATNV